MQSAQDRASDNVAAARGVVVGSVSRDALTDSLMRSASIEIGDVFPNNPPKVILAEDQKVIEALVP